MIKNKAFKIIGIIITILICIFVIIVNVIGINIKDKEKLTLNQSINTLQESNEQLSEKYDNLKISYENLQTEYDKIIIEQEEINKDINELKDLTKMIKESAEANKINSGSKLTAQLGVNYFRGNKETYYNLDMAGVINIAKCKGYIDTYWVREDGVKMYGKYVIVAANYKTHPYGSIVETSLGTGIVLDTGNLEKNQFDIAVDW